MPLVTRPRTEIHPSGHTDIDLSLKRLKASSRDLAKIIPPYSSELRILERIYYKGKNQHRSALFWRKVVEIRRFTTRIDGLNLHRLADELRLSFHAAGLGDKAKSLKRAWTHVPDIPTCRNILKKFRVECLLVDRTRVRLRAAYQSFILHLQTAAFLPLIVTLVAVASRFDFLLAELRNIVRLQWDAIIDVANVVDPTSHLKEDHKVRLPSLPMGLCPLGETTSTENQDPFFADNSTEDLGTRVVDQSDSYPAFADPPLAEASSPTNAPPPSASAVQQASHAAPSTVVETLVVYQNVADFPGEGDPPSDIPVESSKPKSTRATRIPERIENKRDKRDKKKKKPDAIDDIFSTLGE